MTFFTYNPLLPWEIQCNGKIYYPNPDSALHGCHAMAMKEPGKVFRIYECPHCDGYHVGSIAGGDKA